jgi:hypothetical protein
MTLTSLPVTLILPTFATMTLTSCSGHNNLPYSRRGDVVVFAFDGQFAAFA